MNQTPPEARFRFGIFEADPATGELRRKGSRVRLNAQPFALLVMLLERPGEVVTREEIVGRLWPDGTFVDFDHGVNSAINRLREALGDHAAQPRYIETLARRGYRFLAPVERIDPGAPAFQSELIPDPPAKGGILASPSELPRIPAPLTRAFFVALQLMYLAFYVSALANLAEIDDLLSPLGAATVLFDVTAVSAAVLIAVRVFLLAGSLLQPPGAGAKLLKIWPALLLADLLWALSPFLLLHHIPYGLALACTALLVFSPFAQRSLLLMGAAGTVQKI